MTYDLFLQFFFFCKEYSQTIDLSFGTFLMNYNPQSLSNLLLVVNKLLETQIANADPASSVVPYSTPMTETKVKIPSISIHIVLNTTL